MGLLRFEHLGSGVFAAVSQTHAFGTDALLLADFAKPQNRERVCDLCSGCGVIPLLFLRGGHESVVTAIELQQDACELIESGLNKSGLSGRVDVFARDLKEVGSYLPANSFDLVTVNPPYFPVDSGISPADLSARLVRTELGCGIGDVAKAASWLLRSGGRLCLCHRPERLCDVVCALRDARLEPKKLRFVQTDSGTSPWLFLLEARLDAKPSLDILPPLITSDKETMNKIYGPYGLTEQD